MNYPGAGQSPPVLPPPPKKGPPALLIVLGILALALLAALAKAAPVALIVLGALVLLAALAVVSIVRAVHAAQEESKAAIVVGDSFIGSLGQHGYGNARALMTPQVRATTTAQSLEDGQTLTEKRHGAFLGHGEPQAHVQKLNGRTSIQLAYPVQFSESESVISLVLVDEGDGYQVYAVNYAL